jgi:hypothetical protein
LELLAVFVLGLALGLVLGYCSMLPRVKVTEKALKTAEERVSDLDLALKKKKMSLGAELNRQQMEKHQWKSWGQG